MNDLAAAREAFEAHGLRALEVERPAGTAGESAGVVWQRPRP